MPLKFNDIKSNYNLNKKKIDNNIKKVISHGQFIMGPEIELLEKKLSAFSGTKYCITTSSGTDALLISLMQYGIQEGDEVITSPFSWISTAEVISLLKAKPIFVDIQEDSCNLDPLLIKKAITKKTKAIIPISLFGQPADLKEVRFVARENGNIPVIEDAAQSFGAKYKNKSFCYFTDVACTSFFPSKPLGCFGDGGAIFTNSKKIAEKCRALRLHGQVSKNSFKYIGINGRMDTLQAAILLGKFNNYKKELNLRIKAGEYYNYLFDKYKVRRLKTKKDRENIFAQYVVFHHKRESILKSLKKEGIPTAIYYPKLISDQKAYFNSVDFPVSKRISKEIFSVPFSPYISKKTQEKIVKLISKITS